MAWTGFGGGGSSNDAKGWNDSGAGSYTRSEGGWTNSYNDKGQVTGSTRNTNTQGSGRPDGPNGGSDRGGSNGTKGSGNEQSTIDARAKQFFGDVGKQQWLTSYYNIAKKQGSAKHLPGMYKGAIQKMLDMDKRDAAQKAANTAAGAAKAAAQKAAQKAASDKAAAAERARQAAITTERTTRTNLTNQLNTATSSQQIAGIQKQLAGLGTLSGSAADNKALADRAAKQLGDFTARETDSAIGSAQSTVSAAQGTVVSAAQQARNTAEANRMGGYDDRSTADKLGDVAKAVVGGGALGGIPGALIGAGASVYNSFVNNTRGAGSSTQTEGQDVTKATPGNALSGAALGAIKGAGYGSVLGPGGTLLGGALGAIWGGASAAGVTPDLSGKSPLEGGQVTNTGSMGPGQQLVNGVWVGNGNGGNKPPVIKQPNTGAVTTPGTPNVSTPTQPGTKPPTGTPSTPGTGTDGSIKAGNGAFNNYLTELRKRQLDNLLSTGAGYSGTSGTALLGRVGAAQGAAGGLTGYVQSSLGGGKSLLGGAWSF